MAGSDHVVYLDASAFIKLIVAEPESKALERSLDVVSLTSSTLLEVETVRAVRRVRPASVPRAHALLARLDLVEIDADVRRIAGELDHPGLRSLDAIHLATALSLGDRCGTFYAYDERLLDAARAHGLVVSAPV